MTVSATNVQSVFAVEPIKGAENLSQPIDLVFLSRQTMGNRVLEQEILRLFVQQLVISLDRLKVCASSKDWVEICHAIKSSALSVGAEKLADAACDAGKQHAVCETHDGKAYISLLEGLISDVSNFVAEILAE